MMPASRKDRREHVTRTSRIEWTITGEKPARKAVWHILEPQYHGHIWTACSAVSTPEEKEITTYGFRLDPAQGEALLTALNMAVRWTRGRPLKGKKIPAGMNGYPVSPD